MKLTKSETEKLTIALFKLGRSKPTLSIGELALRLADELDAEWARTEAAEKAAKNAAEPQLPLPAPEPKETEQKEAKK